MIVYCATNIINNKKYIGYTKQSLEKRIKDHLYRSKYKSGPTYNTPFKCAIRKYGIENFKWEIIEKYSLTDECRKGEKRLIKKIDTISPNGYNLHEGGLGGRHSEEVNKKISRTLKQRWKNNDHPLNNISSEDRSKRAKKAWKTKKENGFKSPSGFKRSNESKIKMSNTKNDNNKINWINNITNEKVYLSQTKMAEYTRMSVSTFCHLKNGRAQQTKNGWSLNLKLCI